MNGKEKLNVFFFASHYTLFHFNDIATIILPLHICAYDVGANTEKEGKLCDIEGLKRKKD